MELPEADSNLRGVADSKYACAIKRAAYHKRSGAKEYRKSQATGKPCDCDPLRPVDCAWEAALEDHYFGRSDIEEPALLFGARTLRTAKDAPDHHFWGEKFLAIRSTSPGQ